MGTMPTVELPTLVPLQVEIPLGVGKVRGSRSEVARTLNVSSTQTNLNKALSMHNMLVVSLTCTCIYIYIQG